jgi:exopolysaccharide biosynthesis protein
MFLYSYLPLLFFKNKQITKTTLGYLFLSKEPNSLYVGQTNRKGISSSTTFLQYLQKR